MGTLDLKPKAPGSFFFEGDYCYSCQKKKKKKSSRTTREREKWLLLKSQSRLLGDEWGCPLSTGGRDPCPASAAGAHEALGMESRCQQPRGCHRCPDISPVRFDGACQGFARAGERGSFFSLWLGSAGLLFAQSLPRAPPSQQNLQGSLPGEIVNNGGVSRTKWRWGLLAACCGQWAGPMCPVTLAPHLPLPALLFVKACAEVIGFAFQRKDLLAEVTVMNVIKVEVLCSPWPPSRPSGPGKAQAVNSPGSPWQQAANL